MLERGLRTPTLAVILRLANALRTTPSRLITETASRLRSNAQESEVPENHPD
jgi:transcriptional regulator with XRE-family HTH domain